MPGRQKIKHARLVSRQPRRDNTKHTITLTDTNVGFVLGLVRSAYAKTTKEREVYKRRHGHYFQPQEGKEDITLVRLRRMEPIERYLSSVVGETSMFDERS